MEQELNKKLALWVGFTDIVTWEDARTFWGNHPDSVVHSFDCFTQSLDACFKWLVPKFLQIKESEHIHIVEAYEILFRWWHEELIKTAEPNSLAVVTHPALALCKSIEKLIDGGG